MGVVRRHSRERSGSVPLCLALSMVFLTVWIMRSANPLDWGYLGELVTCLNPQSAANVLNSRQSYCQIAVCVVCHALQTAASELR